MKQFIKRLVQARPVAEAVISLNRVAVSGYEGDIFTRFSKDRLFRDLNHGTRALDRSVFAQCQAFILSDQVIPDDKVRTIGPVVESLDGFTDEQIATSVFYIYFLCDSDALPHIRRISKVGGRYVPHLSFDKTDFRFTDRLVHNAMRRTWAKRDRVSHLTPVVHENICEALSITRKLEGDYVEIGVFRGGSALTAINFIDEYRSADPALPLRKAWLLDTFDGFNYDEAFDSPDAIWAGTHALSGVGPTVAFISETLSGTSVPYELVPGNICADDLPSGIDRIAVANIDVDMFEPTYDALVKVSPKVVKGGIVICEDPASTPGLYGALQAMEDFLETDQGARYMKLFKKGQYFLIAMA